MKKRNNHLNKFERMLLESKFPTLRVLLEEKEESSDLSDLFGGSDDEKKSDNSSDDASKSEEKSDDGDKATDDLFGDDSGSDSGDSGNDSGGEGGDDTGGEEGGEEGGDDTGGEGAAKEDKASEDELKKKEDEAITKAAETASKIYSNIVTGNVDSAAGNDLTNRIFNNSGFGNDVKGKKNEAINRQRKRLSENITKYLFKNVSMNSVKRKNCISLSDFRINEKKLLKISRVLKEENSIDDIINDEFWQDNASIDVIVNNAINLTKNFENVIDIPALIMNSVAIKFGKQAAEESANNQNAENEYKLKLDEFLNGYSRSLNELPEYENYDTSKFRLSNPKPSPNATGAFNPGG
jgi:hypothetical protein